MPIPNPWRIPAPLIWLAQNVKLKEPKARQESQQDKFSCTVFHVNVFSGAWEAVMWETHCRAFLSGLFFNNDEEKYMPLGINLSLQETSWFWFNTDSLVSFILELLNPLAHQVSQPLLFLWLAQAHITVSSAVHTLAQALLYTVLASGWHEQMQSSEQGNGKNFLFKAWIHWSSRDCL